MKADHRVCLLAAAMTIVAAASGCDGSGNELSGTTSSDSGNNSASSSSGGESVLWASVVAETEAGAAPARVRLFNDTDHILTLQVGGATFWQIAGRYERTTDQLAVSAAIVEDIRLGFHETKSPQAPCVFLDLFAVVGDSALTPGTLHRFHLTGESIEGLQVEVETAGPAAAYLAVRVGHSAALVGLQSVALNIDGISQAFQPSFSGLGDYRQVGDDSVYLDEVRVSALQEWTASLDVTLAGAHGYTVMVGQRVEEPLAEAPLELVP